MDSEPANEALLKKVECLEADNARLNATLKDLEDQLRQSQKIESIVNLTGEAAHNLNNILAGIVTYPEILLMDLPEDSTLRTPIKTIKQSGEKAASIVRDLLILTRNRAPVSQVLNLNDVIKQLKGHPEFQGVKLSHPDVIIVFELEMPLQNITGSSVLILISLVNLIIYSAESIENKGRITVSTENIEITTPQKNYNQITEKGNYIVLSIADTGPGISEKDLHKIFEPFYTKKVMGKNGTGLEMPIIWNIVKEHNGYIDIITDEGRGTTFSLYFPAADTPHKEK